MSTVMTRRDALARIAYLMGGTLLISETFLSGTRLNAAEPVPKFSSDDVELMDEIGETIIPATATPGAKAAKVGSFMVVMVADCYDSAHQALIQIGLKKIEELSQQRYGKSFRKATPAQRTELLTALDVEQKAYQRTKAQGEVPHFFRLMKELTLVGYFTSEIGATQALKYVEVPGRFDGNVRTKKAIALGSRVPRVTSSKVFSRFADFISEVGACLQAMSDSVRRFTRNRKIVCQQAPATERWKQLR